MQRVHSSAKQHATPRWEAHQRTHRPKHSPVCNGNKKTKSGPSHPPSTLNCKRGNQVQKNVESLSHCARHAPTPLTATALFLGISFLHMRSLLAPHPRPVVLIDYSSKTRPLLLKRLLFWAKTKMPHEFVRIRTQVLATKCRAIYMLETRGVFCRGKRIIFNDKLKAQMRKQMRILS